jgi:hypothetical protein
MGMTGRILVEAGAPPPPPPPANGAGRIRFTSTSYIRAEGIGTAAIQAERFSGDDGSVGVTFGSIGGGTATAADFTAVSGVLSSRPLRCCPTVT